MGWGFWTHPLTVFRAFHKGNSDKGIARLNLKREQLLEMDLPQLQDLTLNRRKRNRFSFYARLIGWGLAGQLVFLSPLIALIATYFALAY
jgi:hypothetical protein